MAESMAERGLVPGLMKEPISVSNIIAEIDDQYGLLADGRFERECIELLELIDQTRLDQGYIPYDDNQRIILVYELYRVMEKFRGRRRRDGSSYFFDHLMGAVKILVRDIGLNGPASIIAEANHDTLEDLIDEEAIAAAVKDALVSRKRELDRDPSQTEIENITKTTKRKALAVQREALIASLVDTASYAHLISEFDPQAAQEIAQSVREMCIGVTKEKLPTVEATRDATLRNLLAVVMHNVKSVFIKFPDRKHNLLTLGGHLFGKDGKPLEAEALEEAKAKQKKIMDETEFIYLPLARRTRVRNMVRFFVDQCMNFQNPELAASFSALSSKRSSGRIESYEGDVRAEFASNYLVHDIKFIPRGLDFYTAKSGKRFKDLTLDDFLISIRDPMFDIVITTVMESSSDAEPALAMESVLTHVQSYFGDGPDTRVVIERPKKDDMTGIKVHVFNPRFGGQLSIRINDRYVEKKLDRGVLANFQEKPPRELRNLIRPVLDFKAEPDMGQGAVNRGQRELLTNEVGVYDINEVLRLFPHNATVLDFANDIHQEVLWGAQRAYVEDSGPPEATSARPVALIDFLEPGKVYYVESCISKERGDRSQVKMHPVLLFFCQSPTRTRIRQFLKDPWVSEMEGLTEEQLAFIRELNRKRDGNVVTRNGESRGIYAKIGFLRDRMSDGGLNDAEIIEILKHQDQNIYATGLAYINFLSNLFGVNEALIRSHLTFALSLKVGRGSKDRAERRTKINRAVAVGEQKANPLFVLANHFERIKEKVESSLADVRDRLWEVEIVVPDRAGELSDFGKEFSKEIGINLYSFRSRKRPRLHEDVMTFKIDLDGQNISIYEFLVKLVKLRIKYPRTRLIKNPYMRILRSRSGVLNN